MDDENVVFDYSTLITSLEIASEILNRYSNISLKSMGAYNEKFPSDVFVCMGVIAGTLQISAHTLILYGFDPDEEVNKILLNLDHPSKIEETVINAQDFLYNYYSEVTCRQFGKPDEEVVH